MNTIQKAGLTVSIAVATIYGAPCLAKPKLECDHNTGVGAPKFATLPETALAPQCVALQKDYGNLIRPLLGASDFSNQCVVPIEFDASAPPPNPKPACTYDGTKIDKKDQVFVRDWNGEYTLTIRRNKKKFVDIELTPGNQLGGGIPWLWGKDSTGYAYYVYLAQKPTGTTGKDIKKVYQLQVYNTTEQTCADELPEKKYEVVDCFNPTPAPVAGAQTDTGGGTEPPPK